MLSLVISYFVWSCNFIFALCYCTWLYWPFAFLFFIISHVIWPINSMHVVLGKCHYGLLLHLTLGCRHSKQIFPELTTCLTESVFVPYRFCSNSPDSMNFPAARSDSKRCRDTKLYSLPLTSCARGFRVVSVTNVQKYIQVQCKTVGCV